LTNDVSGKLSLHLFFQGDECTDVFKGKVNLELQKLILDQFDVQIAVVIIEGHLMIRVAAQVYNTMEDFIKLGEAVLVLSKQKK
jgi:selenocysteine lyase/cysteine desulfurase